MKIATLAALLLAALSCSHRPCLAQVSTATPRAQATPSVDEAEVREASGEYLTALRRKDWGRVSALTFNDEDNLWLGLTQDLLRPLEIEKLSFEIQEVSVSRLQSGHWEASARYTMGIRATDPRTREPAIELTNLKRVVTWLRFECDCPPRNVSKWRFGGDKPDLPKADMIDALAATKTAHEQRLLTLGSTVEGLEKLATALGVRGYESLAREPDSEAFKWFRLSQIVFNQAKYAHRFEELRELESLGSELDAAREAKDAAREAHLLHAIGSAYLKLGRYEQALKFFNDSLKLAGKAEAAALIYKSMATAYAAQGDDARAVNCYEESLKRYRAAAVGDERYRGISVEELFELLQSLALLYQAQGRDDLASKTIEEILNIDIGSGSAVAILLDMLGVFHRDSGNVVKAIEYFETSAKIVERWDTEDDGELEYRKALLLTGAYFNLFQLYLARHDYAHAAEYFLKLRKAWKEDAEDAGEEPENIYDFMFPMLEAFFYISHGDKSLARPSSQQAFGILFRQSIEAARRGDITDDASEFIQAAALELILKGDLKAARKRYVLLLRLAEADGDEYLIAQAYNGIAGVYYMDKEPRPALENYGKCLRFLERLKPSADVPLSELRELTRETRFFSGVAHALLGEDDQALSSFQRALGVKSGSDFRRERAGVLYQIASVHLRQGRYDKALDAAREALTLMKSGGDLEEIWQFYTLVGQVQRALKRYKLAARSFDDAIAEIEASRSTIVIGEQTRQRFFEDKLSPYHEMIAMLVEQNRCGEAFGYAERSKSRVLLDALRGGRQDVRGVTEQESEREQALRGRMIEAERRFASAQAEDPRNSLTEQLRTERLRARWEFATFRAELMLKYYKPGTSRKVRAGVISPTRAAALLPRGGAALEFVVTEKKTYLFVQTGEDRGARRDPPQAKCVIHTIPVGSDELKKRAVEFNRRVAHPEGVVSPLARELYDLLLGPARAELASRTALLIVPDSYLWSLPFQALQADDGEYLLQRSAVAYAPSLTTLAEMRKVTERQPDRSPTLLALANPRPPNDGAESQEGRGEAYGLAPLPQTEEMSLRLKGLYGRGRSKVYTRGDADERRVKEEAPRADVIHIGAHGFLDDDDPMHSGLVLSRAERKSAAPAAEPAAVSEDGVLEAWELMDMKLRANLVVLSACETARGRVGSGEGVVGLAWALFMAGVPSTVVSQWKVDEGSTSQLMYGFHESLVRGGRAGPTRPRKAEALRRASLKLLDSEAYSHPYYWAGFILIGDGN